MEINSRGSIYLTLFNNPTPHICMKILVYYVYMTETLNCRISLNCLDKDPKRAKDSVKVTSCFFDTGVEGVEEREEK